VADAHREVRVPLVEVGHLAGVELDVGAAHAGPLHVHHDVTSGSDRRLDILDAGLTGRSLMLELRETAGERVVGFVDDNPRLRRRRVHGVPVLGSSEELPRILERSTPAIVLVTIPDAPRDRLDAIVAACADADVTCQFVRREIDLDPRVVLGSTAE